MVEKVEVGKLYRWVGTDGIRLRDHRTCDMIDASVYVGDVFTVLSLSVLNGYSKPWPDAEVLFSGSGLHGSLFVRLIKEEAEEVW